MVVRGVSRGIRRVLEFSVVSGLALGAPAVAEPPVEAAETRSSPAPAEDAAPSVGLDALLRLPPPTAMPKSPEKGGGGPGEWRARFAAARGDLEAAEKALADAQGELEKLASDQESWQVSAPGGQAGADTGPLSYSLRQEIRRQREAVERASREFDDRGEPRRRSRGVDAGAVRRGPGLRTRLLIRRPSRRASVERR
jgi:hypothetical protein